MSPGCTRDAYIGFGLDTGPGRSFGQTFCRECWTREASAFDSEDQAERLLAAVQEMRYRGIRPESPDDHAAVVEIYRQYGLIGDEKPAG
jgi:hypothetical protein